MKDFFMFVWSWILENPGKTVSAIVMIVDLLFQLNPKWKSNGAVHLVMNTVASFCSKFIETFPTFKFNFALQILIAVINKTNTEDNKIEVPKT